MLEYGTTMKAPDYLAINPMGKVPAIRHGAAVVTEVAAICAYLADAFPDAGLAPATDDPRRAAYYRWMFFAAGPLEAAITDMALGVVVPPARRMMAGYGCLDDALDAIEQAVAPGGYLVGDSFTTADLVAASQIGFGVMFKMINDRPVLTAYADRVSNRPAQRRAAAIDDALIAARMPPS